MKGMGPARCAVTGAFGHRLVSTFASWIVDRNLVTRLCMQCLSKASPRWSEAAIACRDDQVTPTFSVLDLIRGSDARFCTLSGICCAPELKFSRKDTGPLPCCGPDIAA